MPNILRGAGDYVFEEKRSKFIAHCEPVTTEDEARTVLNNIRAAHKTATHHVYAYGLAADNTIRHSDDGEPQGTAGIPVLNVFLRRDVVNFVCVVTRYFGGTLLGAGGLVRAYAKAAKEAMEAAGVEPLVRYSLYAVICPYARLEQMKYFFDTQGFTIQQMDYGAQCEAIVKVSEAMEHIFIQNEYYQWRKLE